MIHIAIFIQRCTHTCRYFDNIKFISAKTIFTNILGMFLPEFLLIIELTITST